MQLRLKLRNVKVAVKKAVCNINNDSKSFHAYSRNKQNIRENTGPLEDSAGNII